MTMKVMPPMNISTVMMYSAITFLKPPKDASSVENPPVAMAPKP